MNLIFRESTCMITIGLSSVVNIHGRELEHIQTCWQFKVLPPCYMSLKVFFVKYLQLFLIMGLSVPQNADQLMNK